MQVCNKCKIDKNISEFSFRKKSLNSYQKTCKDCIRKQVQAHYISNRQYYLSKTRKRNERVRKILREYVWEYLLAHQCIDCGESDPVVLEFDHRENKKIDISRAVRDGYSLGKIAEEIGKCEVRCANCHRRKTAKQMNWHKYKIALVAQLD